jgi:hypothetical protein
VVRMTTLRINHRGSDASPYVVDISRWSKWEGCSPPSSALKARPLASFGFHLVKFFLTS